jgi:hypothetical protein
MNKDERSVDLAVITSQDLLFEELEERIAPAAIVPPHGSSSSSSCSSQQ